MPRAGLSTQELIKGGGLSFGAGNGEIVNAAVVIHQFPPSKKEGKDNYQEQLRTKLRLTIQRLDAQWKPTADEPIEEYLPLIGNRKDGEPATDKLRPGNAQSSEDDDPEDLGDAEGVEGNSIYCNAGEGVNEQTKAGKFTKSLEEKGFKPALLNGYMPNLIGLQAHFVTKKEKGEEGSGIGEFGVLLVDQIQKLPYQKGGASAAAKPAATKTTAPAGAKPAAKANGAAGAATIATAVNDAAAIEASAQIVMKRLGERKAGQQVTRLQNDSNFLVAQRIPGQLAVILGDPEIRKQIPVTHDKAVREMIADDDYFLAAAEGLGWIVEGAVVTIP